ncbi:MAG: hypothetical protein BGO12_15580 [Verrucomicrobia bacterium 61-8]|nr:hypothetical protein [Verrucomicrobiota bacterium]OJV03307.1 MAG: hypothetical protein BGO12_15580 [Verrucomicrobia bacterium 61-8]
MPARDGEGRGWRVGKEPPRHAAGPGGPACLAARTPGDLDALALQIERLPASGGDPQAAIRQRGAAFLLAKWRDYLTALGAENNGQVRKALGELLENTEWVSLMPRSPVLERYMEASRMRWVNYPLESLDDFDAAIVKLRAFRARYGLSSEGVTELGQLERLQEIRRQAAELPPERVEAACRPAQDEDGQVTRYKMMILPLVAARYLNLPASFHLPARKGEVAFAYLQRLLELAEKKGDLVAYWRVLAYRAELLRARPAWTVSRLMALDKTLSGLKKESTSETVAALSDYLEALMTAGIPPQVAVCGEHARRIIEAQPDAVLQLSAMRQQDAARSRMSFINRFGPGPSSGMPGFPGEPGPDGLPMRFGEDRDLWKRY